MICIRGLSRVLCRPVDRDDERDGYPNAYSNASGDGVETATYLDAGREKREWFKSKAVHTARAEDEYSDEKRLLSVVKTVEIVNDAESESEDESQYEVEQSKYVFSALSPAKKLVFIPSALRVPRKPVAPAQQQQRRIHVPTIVIKPAPVPQYTKHKADLRHMPVEILLNILSYLQPHILIPFGAVCKRFRNVLIMNNKPFGIWHLPASELAAFKSSFRRMYFCKSCVAAQQTSCDLMDINKPKLLQKSRMLHCSGCQTTHCSFLFGDAEQGKPDHVRQCVGWTGTIRLDSKTGFTFSEICRRAEASSSSSNNKSSSSGNDSHLWTKPWRRFEHVLMPIKHSITSPRMHISITSTMKASTLHPQPHHDKSHAQCRTIKHLSLAKYGGFWRHSLDRNAILQTLRSGAIEQCTQLCPHQSFASGMFRRRLMIADTYSASSSAATASTANVQGGSSNGVKRALNSVLQRAALASTDLRGKTACSECAAYLYISRETCEDSWHSWTFYGIYTHINDFSPSSYDWLMHLERDSFTLPQEAKHLTWCDVESCHTNKAFANRWFEQEERTS